MELRGKSVLVTGGAGFVGSHIVDALVRAGNRVTVIDNLSTGFREFICHPSVELVIADLLDQNTLNRVMAGQDVVFHLAANADIKDGLSHPRLDVEQNILVTQNVLEAMRKNGVNRIAFSSTGSVYGEPAEFPTPEDCRFPIQTSLYATSKLASEGLLSSYAFGYGFQVWVFRFVSVLGPRYSHGHVFDFYLKLKRDPSVLDVLGDGHQQKSYLHVADVVRGVMLAIERADEPINILNLSHTESIEVNNSIGIICEELNVRPELRYSGGIRGWVGDSPRILLDASRLRALGWKPERSIGDSIRDTLRYLAVHSFLFAGRGMP